MIESDHPKILYPRTQADEVAEFRSDLQGTDSEIWDNLYHNDSLNLEKLPEFASPELRYPDSPADGIAEVASEEAWQKYSTYQG